MAKCTLHPGQAEVRDASMEKTMQRQPIGAPDEMLAAVGSPAWGAVANHLGLIPDGVNAEEYRKFLISYGFKAD